MWHLAPYTTACRGMPRQRRETTPRSRCSVSLHPTPERVVLGPRLARHLGRYQEERNWWETTHIPGKNGNRKDNLCRSMSMISPIRTFPRPCLVGSTINSTTWGG